MSLTTEKPRSLVAAEEEDKVSRNVLKWLNTFPEMPETIDTIKYEYLQDNVVGLALSTIQGTYITQRYIVGGYQAEYQFKIIYRLIPGSSMDKRLKADELLDRLGDWCRRGKPNLGEGLRVVRVEPTTRSSLFAMYENGDEDHQILLKLTYEVI